ncbi:hypothetical protein [Fuerstiella marisgermanici]|uniref:Uncharacterized protein n=1 Tax=Fuerstiella marisgermanici TaxID=1891926 RepID=A0A1P8WMF0_9PLAN|nr:hypothetical protein [Fuerstiella marisgermanici]APZ95211.1 hypothetical protein Fuma_04867 [Fuerstiella marisgermanici]
MSVCRLAFTTLLISGLAALADEPKTAPLTAPSDWGGETIALPPGFAKDMTFEGVEHIRFAPGMMKPDSDTFFCYAFAFELKAEPKLTQATVQAEFLKYYRGLCTAVLNGAKSPVDPKEFTCTLEVIKPDKPTSTDNTDAIRYSGTIKWVEPFATRKPQTLKLEIRTWTQNDRNFLFACVSPQDTDKAIWKQLRKIRDDYVERQGADK